MKIRQASIMLVGAIALLGASLVGSGAPTGRATAGGRWELARTGAFITQDRPEATGAAAGEILGTVDLTFFKTVSANSTIQGDGDTSGLKANFRHTFSAPPSELQVGQALKIVFTAEDLGSQVPPPQNLTYNNLPAGVQRWFVTGTSAIEFQRVSDAAFCDPDRDLQYKDFKSLDDSNHSESLFSEEVSADAGQPDARYDGSLTAPSGKPGQCLLMVMGSSLKAELCTNSCSSGLRSASGYVEGSSYALFSYQDGPGSPGSTASSHGSSAPQGVQAVWLSRQKDGSLQKVAGYPSGVTEIIPGFEYARLPADTDIVILLSRDGKVILNYTARLKAGERPGTFSLPVQMKNKAAFADGLYRVEFYQAKKLLAFGETRVGGAQPLSTLVRVNGVVIDANTGQPIPNANVAVLLPGISAAAWSEQGYPSQAVLADGVSDAAGRFNLFDPGDGISAVSLERNVPYSLVAWADGYQNVTADGVVIDNRQPDPVMLTIRMRP